MGMRLYDLRTMHMTNPVIDRIPYFSWKIQSGKKNVLQTAYEITVKEADTDRQVWCSGKVESSSQSFIGYEGSSFHNNTTYNWQVHVWNNLGEEASGRATFETSLFSTTSWTASWIECSYPHTHAPVLFEKQFELPKPVARARAYATCYGIYRLTINGKRPDDREFAPEYTPYLKDLCYQTYDITALLQNGSNILNLYVGEGWYFSPFAGPVSEDLHAEPSVLFQLEITYSDGTTQTICSDGTETCRRDYILSSDLYMGEAQDLTLAEDAPHPVVIKDYGYDQLRAQPMPPVRPIKSIPAKRVFTTPAGETVVDFGQNIAGRARVQIHEPKGTKITLDYFEVLNAEGNYVNTMFPLQEDTVITDGSPFTHEALFTFHGFQYIRVSGIEDVKAEDFTAVLLSTEKPNASRFETSDPRLNRLYQNVRFSQYNNMMSVPTDCPTREKAGWTGDILIYAKTAIENEDVTPFLTNWLHSVRMDQQDDGVITIVSPYMKLYDPTLRRVMKTFGDSKLTGVAGWSDAIVWVPLTMYEMTGNKPVLSENFEAMTRWCDWMIRTAHDKRGFSDIPAAEDQYLWNTGFHYGEWLIPSEGEDKSGEQWGICKRTAWYAAPFYGYETLRKMTKICGLLGKTDWEEKYKTISGKMRDAIQNVFFRRDRMPKDIMGACVMAFAFDLIPEEFQDEYHDRLVALIHQNGDRLDTGFLATPFLLDVLWNLGEKELALTILWQDQRPSWLYEVDHGATTIWEAWDADNAKREHRYVSFDHYAFGCVDDFVCRKIAGISVDDAEHRHFHIEPYPTERLTCCKRSWESESGKVTVEWNPDGLQVQIPANTTATVVWGGKTYELGSGQYNV